MKRALVDIYPANHHRLEKIRAECRRLGRTVPSMPALVNQAIEERIAMLEAEYIPAATTPTPTRNARKTKVSA